MTDTCSLVSRQCQCHIYSLVTVELVCKFSVFASISNGGTAKVVDMAERVFKETVFSALLVFYLLFCL